MRTTLNISDALAGEAKARAAAEGLTFTSFIEEALRDRLRKDRRATLTQALPTFGDPRGAGFRVDIDDKEALWDALDDRG